MPVTRSASNASKRSSTSVDNDSPKIDAKRQRRQKDTTLTAPATTKRNDEKFAVKKPTKAAAKTKAKKVATTSDRKANKPKETKQSAKVSSNSAVKGKTTNKKAAPPITANPAPKKSEPVISRPPLNDTTIREAVALWRMNKQQAIDQYGPISQWNTSEVTDMDNLLTVQSIGAQFDEDIGDWDVRKVTTMKNLMSEQYRFPRKCLQRWKLNSLRYSEGIRIDELLNYFNKPLKTDLECFMLRESIPVELRAIVKSYVGKTKLTDRTIESTVQLWKRDKALAFRTYGHISEWDVSQVTNMDRLFEIRGLDCSFGGDTVDLNDWDVSHVTSMKSMFKGNYQTFLIDRWDVSNVVDMSKMLYSSSSADQPFGRWNVSKVRSMDNMFHYASFNHSLQDWDVSNVRNMCGMFSNCSKFNQPLNKWNVSNVHDMSHMFREASAFNQPLDKWNVTAVTTMTAMFKDAKAFNQSIDSWNCQSVTTMNNMFEGALVFNQPLNRWKVNGVTRMDRMFSNAKMFNQPLDNWNVSNVSDMRAMFNRCEHFNQPLTKWNVKSLRFAQDMFNDSAISKSVNGKVMEKWQKSNDLLEYEEYEKYVRYQEGPVHCIRIIRCKDKKQLTDAELRNIQLNEEVGEPDSDEDW